MWRIRLNMLNNVNLTPMKMMNTKQVLCIVYNALSIQLDFL